MLNEQSQLSIQDIDVICQQYLTALYQESKSATTGRYISETSGEILYASIDKILAKLDLTEHDVFADLGSGLGKIVAQVFLKYPVKKAIGIEILPELHAQAVAVAKRIKTDLPEWYLENRQLEFVLGDILQTSLPGTTIVLLNATCYTQAMLHAIGKIINHTKTVRAVLSLRPIPHLEHMQFKRTVRIECSWDSALCYEYLPKIG